MSDPDRDQIWKAVSEIGRIKSPILMTPTKELADQVKDKLPGFKVRFSDLVPPGVIYLVNPNFLPPEVQKLLDDPDDLP